MLRYPNLRVEHLDHPGHVRLDLAGVRDRSRLVYQDHLVATGRILRAENYPRVREEHQDRRCGTAGLSGLGLIDRDHHSVGVGIHRRSRVHCAVVGGHGRRIHRKIYHYCLNSRLDHDPGEVGVRFPGGRSGHGVNGHLREAYRSRGL